jgi:protein TonB
MDERDEDGGLKRFALPVGLVLLLALGGWLIYKNMGHSGKGARTQTVKIAVLPDTPPPPPPPPKEEKPPEPQKEDKPQPQEQPKQVEAPPESAPLKMEGAAGDGPSAFSSGSVSSEYKGGEIGNGGGGVASVGDKLAASSYGNAIKREVNEFLNRDAALKRAGDYKLAVRLWVQADGSLERYVLDGSSGTPETDEAIRQALQRFNRFRNPPPPSMPQPIRLQVTNRMTG